MIDIFNPEEFAKIDFSPKVNQAFSDVKADNIKNLSDNSQLLVQTDMEGYIQYANKEFQDIFFSEENGASIIGKEIFVIDHPAIPKSILSMVQQQVDNDDDTNAIFINLCSCKKVVIAYAEVDVVKDRYGQHIHIFSRRRRISDENINNAIIPFYKFLLQKEATEGVEATEIFIRKFIQKNHFKDFNHLMEFLAFGDFS